MLYGTFNYRDLTCDGEGFNNNRKGRAYNKDFAPTVIASALRVAPLSPEQKRQAIAITFPHWKKGSYYIPVISSYFWLEMLPVHYKAERGEICLYLKNKDFGKATDLEKVLIAYADRFHCQESMNLAYKKYVRHKVRSNEAFSASPLWYYDHYLEEGGGRIIGYDKGLIAYALALQVYRADSLF